MVGNGGQQLDVAGGEAAGFARHRLDHAEHPPPDREGHRDPGAHLQRASQPLIDWFAGRLDVLDERKREQLLLDASIVRNRLKIAAAIQNAKSFLAVREEFGSFDNYIWQFVDGVPRKRKRGQGVPTHTPESDALSKDLARRGFKFVGTTICYAFMQAVGMVNDHNLSCFRYREIQ